METALGVADLNKKGPPNLVEGGPSCHRAGRKRLPSRKDWGREGWWGRRSLRVTENVGTQFTARDTRHTFNINNPPNGDAYAPIINSLPSKPQRGGQVCHATNGVGATGQDRREWV
jgi:hypothetical protein